MIAPERRSCKALHPQVGRASWTGTYRTVLSVPCPLVHAVLVVCYMLYVVCCMLHVVCCMLCAMGLWAG